MLTLIIVLGAVIAALHLRTLIVHEEEHRAQLGSQLENGEHTWSVISIWNSLMEQYGVPFAHYFVSVAYSIYVRLTIINVVCLLICINEPVNISMIILNALNVIAVNISPQVCADGTLYVQIHKRHVRDFSRENKTETNRDGRHSTPSKTYPVFNGGEKRIKGGTPGFNVWIWSDSDSEHEAVRARRGVLRASRAAAAWRRAAAASARARA